LRYFYSSKSSDNLCCAKIKNKLAASGYANIRIGLTKVNGTVGRIRSIKVTILGEVRKPGTYTLPFLATAFNALYLSGRPTDIGSSCNIEIIRSKTVLNELNTKRINKIKSTLKDTTGFVEREVERSVD
jgi:protein involved in polysaccharide export with SLBB domain